MVTHGSESYFVIGEGLLAESVGGRNGSENGAAPAVVLTQEFARLSGYEC